MQQSATIDAHGLRGFLELVLAGLVVLTMIIILLLVTAPRGPLLSIILAAATSLAATLLAGPLSAILTLLLVPPFIFSFLLFRKQLDLLAVLAVMALGAMDLAVLLVGAPWLVGSRQGPVGGAPGSFFAGVTVLAFLEAPGSLDPSTTSTVLHLRFLLQRRPFFVGAAASSSVESISASASSPG